jgi:hypothetical protein
MMSHLEHASPVLADHTQELLGCCHAHFVNQLWLEYPLQLKYLSTSGPRRQVASALHSAPVR